MPYVLSPIINEDFKALWNEGAPFKKEKIYEINSDKQSTPPVNYSSYTFKPHSLTHLETGAHTSDTGKTIDWYFRNKRLGHFFGKVVLVKLEGLGFVEHETIEGIRYWEVSEDELISAVWQITRSEEPPSKLLIAPVRVPTDENGLHRQDHVFVLSEKAADYLSSAPDFSLFGTSWKSTDFQPFSKSRPIHNTLFEKAVILENLRLSGVPRGEYFINAFPLPIAGASESPVCPVLFSKEEIGFMA